MVEVFRTNVQNEALAKVLTERISALFAGYAANFDLEDRDKILRIETGRDSVDAMGIILLFKRLGLIAELLEDDPVDNNYQFSEYCSAKGSE